MGERSSLKREIYDSVFEDIIEGKYRQNEIINEKQLIDKYGVSKSPVRDALQELCSEGVLLCRPRYGYEVVRINEEEIREIIVFRVILETACLRETCRHIRQQEILELEDYTKNSCCNKDESVTFIHHWENNMSFHTKLISYCGNEYCLHMLEKSIRIMTRAYAQRNWERTGAVAQLDCEDHLKIIRHMKQNDVEGAVKALKEDISSFYTLLYPCKQKLDLRLSNTRHSLSLHLAE